MPQLEFGLDTEDGLWLHVREWLPDEVPQMVVCLIHGHGEHAGRYDHLARFLNGLHCTVLAMDLRGHGESEGKRGHITSYKTLMNDVSLLLVEANRRHPDLALFLYGHSMGGNLVVNYTLRCNPGLNGVIASAPLFRTAFPQSPWKTILGRVMRYVWPAMPLSSGLNTQDLSRDPAVVHAYENDLFVHDHVTPRFLDVLQAGEWALEHAGELSVPLLLMHGEADRITSCPASRLFASGAGPDCTLRTWKNLYHEIHNEPEREEVYSCVAEWLENLRR